MHNACISNSDAVVSAVPHMLCPLTGADVAAADAGQIPDHVRPNHREKYPTLLLLQQ